MVLDYNQHMGGIDTFDMMLYAYLDERRTMKYWKKAVFNIFSRMVLNSYVIYKENKMDNQEKPMSRYRFVVSIIDSLTDEWLASQEVNRPGPGGDNNARVKGLVKLPDKKEKTCRVCTKGGQNYKQCGRKRSRTVCNQCGEGCHGACFPKHKCV